MAGLDSGRDDDSESDASSEGRSRPSVSGFTSLALVVVVAMGLFAQGGYNPRGQILIALGAALLAGLLVAGWAGGHNRPLSRVTIAAAPLGVWLLFVGFVTDSFRAGAGALGVVAACSIAYETARRMSRADRSGALVGLLGVGVVIAAMGWVGVAFRVDPWAVATPNTWRASAPLTYANATAAVICLLALVSISARIDRSPSRVTGAVTTMLIVGLAATGSRGGWVAFAVGVVVLGLLSGVRRTFEAVSVPLIASLVGFIALVPSMFGSSAKPAVAAAGLVAALGLAYLIPQVSPRFSTPLLFALVAALGVGVVLYLGADQFDLLRTRLNISNGDRGRAWEAAIDMIVDHPFVGEGVGRADLAFLIGDQMYVMKYVHNEFLQAAAEIGLIALALVGWFFWASVDESRNHDDGKLIPLAVAVVAAFGVHSSVDFLWHFPALPILAFTLAGLAASSDST